jgi:hypothetical protein
VHVLARGAIQRSGGPELALELESTGYAAFGDDTTEASGNGHRPADPLADPLADPRA